MSETRCGVMSVDALAAEIKKGLCGAYLFYGDEDYLKSYYRDAVYHAVMTEGMEAFNYFGISFSPASNTREAAMERLSDAVDAMPMMQDKKLIAVTDLPPASLPKELFDTLITVLGRASNADDTVLLLVCRPDEIVTDYKLETAAFYKKLLTAVKMVRFDLQPRGKLISFTKRLFAKETVLISDEAAGLLTELTAGRMMPLTGEIGKLLCYAKYVKGGEPPKIDEEDVKRIASASSPDEIPFAMLGAAQSFRLSEMLAVMNTARDEREEPITVLAKLSRIYLDMLLIKTASEDAVSVPEIAKTLKMKEFRVSKTLAAIGRVPLAVIEKAVRIAYDTDLALKSTTTDPWVLLDRMIVDIYAPKSLRQGGAPCS